MPGRNKLATAFVMKYVCYVNEICYLNGVASYKAMAGKRSLRPCTSGHALPNADIEIPHSLSRSSGSWRRGASSFLVANILNTVFDSERRTSLTLSGFGGFHIALSDLKTGAADLLSVEGC